MIAKTKDSRVEVEYVQKISDCVFPPADWSIINVPETKEGSEKLAKALYNTPQSNHVLLAVNRYNRKKRLTTLSSFPVIEANNWHYLETVNISYEKPSSCSNNGLLPISEMGVLYYKGEKPNCQATEWFSDGAYNNATNFWDIKEREADGEPSITYYQKFSWELSLLLRALCGNLSTRRFIYGADMNADEIISIHNFCKKYDYTAKVYVFDSVEAKKIVAMIGGLK